jgi:ABC-2 type transport system ATP-binding protein
MLALSVVGLTKRDQKGRALLQDVQLELPKGQVLGLVGVNGAGKTTTFKCLLGLTKCEFKTLEILGVSVQQALRDRAIGWAPERPILFEHLTAEEHLRMVSPSSTAADTRQIIEKVGLADRAAGKYAGEYSKGMRQRLAIGLALIHKPKLLILDEPFSGLDFVGRQELRAFLLSLKAEGISMILSSHHTFDLLALCDRLSLLHKGKVIANQVALSTRDPGELEGQFLSAIGGASL